MVSFYILITIVKIDNCLCGGIDLPSHDNELKILIRQLIREVKKLMQTINNFN